MKSSQLDSNVIVEYKKLSQICENNSAITNISLNLILVGEFNVGKTSIINRFVYNKFFAN